MTSTLSRRLGVAAVTLGLVAGGVLAAGPAEAKSGRVVNSGSCSKGGTWKLKAAPDNGKIQVEYEVNARSGQKWTVVISDNGVTRVRTSRITSAGALHVNARIANMAGTDTIKAVAKNTVTGSVCTGSVKL